MTKVAVAMSGGVDSSVAAALCVEKYGKENVFGVTMRLFCELKNEDDAKLVCDQLGIKHYFVNMEKEFEQEVVNNFIHEYQEGNTPNPCVRCNRVIKFGALLEKSKELGADLLATGHYARLASGTKQGAQSKYRLLKGIDTNKDQSYFLYTLNQEQLANVEFPLGGMKKEEVRELAKKLQLKTAEKTESQDICFVTTSLRDFLEPKVKFEEGNIVTKDGKIVGKHEGLPFYTIGQRKGLGGGFAEPMYVIGVNVKNNELIVGFEQDLYSNDLLIDKSHWISGQEPKMPFKCKAKIRYGAEEAGCTIINYQLSIIKVRFDEPQKAITPGQSCVFYVGEEVVGGGIISI